MPKHLLVVAYHFPPCQGSSGLQRPLSLIKYLPKLGWNPVVLTVHPRAYPQLDQRLLDQVPTETPVCRATAFDTARHFSIRGRYVSWMGYPDRWVSWLLGALPSGWRLIRRYKALVIWTTYPIATAHLVGLFLHKLTGIPWIADFRDPMTEGVLGAESQQPKDPTIWRIRRWVERLVVRNCTRLVFVAPGALAMYQERYPEVPRSRWCLIPNGYDEDSFLAAETIVKPATKEKHPLVLLHSGLLYAGVGDRNPEPFFDAIVNLRRKGVVDASSLKVVLRATGHDDVYRDMIRRKNLGDIVFLEPPIPYIEALAEMLQADGLLLIQGSISNPNIPAKFYEYVRARRPIFALVDDNGDTARALQKAGVGIRASLDSVASIETRLSEFLGQVHAGTARIADDEEVRRHSRESKVYELACLLSEVVRA